MKDDNLIQGLWWLDGEDNPPVQGTLSIHADSLVLRVWIPKTQTMDELVRGMGDHSRMSVRQTIVGTDQHRNPVTLFGCGNGGSSFTIGGTEITINALMVLKGLKISAWQNPQVNAVKFETKYLHRWFNQRPVVNVQLADNKHGFSTGEWLDLPYPVTEGITVRFVDYPSPSSDEDAHHYTRQSSVWLQFDLARSLEEIVQVWQPWTSTLLGLMVGERMEITKVHVFTLDPYLPSKGSKISDSSGELIWKLKEANCNRPGPGTRDMLVPFASIRERLGEIVSDWHRVFTSYRAVVDLFGVIALHETLYSEAEFLFLVQAFETYHASSKRFLSADLSDDEKAERLANVKKLLTEELWSWVKGKLQMNSRSLKQKLSDLFLAHKDKATRLLGTDLITLASKIAYTRNHLTHHISEVDRDRLIPERELFEVSWGLRALLWVVLLRELKIDDSLIEALVQRMEGVRFIHLDS